jgi:antitoxin VapB
MVLKLKRAAAGRSAKRGIKSAPSDVRRAAVMSFLKKRVWPMLPKEEIGRPLTRPEEDDILGLGPNGV